MKFICTKDNLQRGLVITSFTGGKQIDLPILSNVLMKVEGGAMRLVSTNLEIATSCVVRGKAEQDGEFTVPVKLFLDFVSLLPQEQVELEVKENSLHVSCGSHNTTIHGLSASEYPLIPSVDGGEEYIISANELKSAISRVQFAVASNEARPEISGVYAKLEELTSGKQRVTFAATDSYRLAEHQMAFTGSKQAQESILPSKTCMEIGRILSAHKDALDAPEEAKLVFTDTQCVFRYGSVELVSRVIDGTYPDYKQIIPTSFSMTANVNAQELVKAIKAASLFSRTGLYDVKLEFKPSEQSIVIRGADTSRGENIVSCAAKIEGEENNITLNYRYMLDGLQAVGTGDVLIQTIDAANPCLVKPASGDDYLYIVMPIRQ